MNLKDIQKAYKEFEKTKNTTEVPEIITQQKQPTEQQRSDFLRDLYGKNNDWEGPYSNDYYENKKFEKYKDQVKSVGTTRENLIKDYIKVEDKIANFADKHPKVFGATMGGIGHALSYIPKVGGYVAGAFSSFGKPFIESRVYDKKYASKQGPRNRRSYRAFAYARHNKYKQRAFRNKHAGGVYNPFFNPKMSKDENNAINQLMAGDIYGRHPPEWRQPYIKDIQNYNRETGEYVSPEKQQIRSKRAERMQDLKLKNRIKEKKFQEGVAQYKSTHSIKPKIVDTAEAWFEREQVRTREINAITAKMPQYARDQWFKLDGAAADKFARDWKKGQDEFPYGVKGKLNVKQFLTKPTYKPGQKQYNWVQ